MVSNLKSLHIIVRVLNDKDHFICKCGWEGETKGVPAHMVKNQYNVDAKTEK